MVHSPLETWRLPRGTVAIEIVKIQTRRVEVILPPAKYAHPVYLIASVHRVVFWKRLLVQTIIANNWIVSKTHSLRVTAV
jgi:hypothetical protein